jgi:phage-related tail fiber protein
MTIGGADGDVIVDDAAGETVTISKWITRRTTAQEIADLARSYVDAQLAKIASRKVRVASTAGITLATGCENGDTIDGVTLATGDRVLLKNQTSGAENGIWVVAASGSPTRATDADSSAELVNASVWVAEGTANADTLWTCTTNAPITVGTTALTFTQFVAGGYSDENA